MLTSGVELNRGSLQALDDLLSTIQRPWSRLPHVLTVGAALEELAVTLQEVADGRKAPQSADRGSLACDLDRALTRAGGHLRRATVPDFRHLRAHEVSNLAATLDDPAECKRVAALARDVLLQLHTSTSVAAAWDDVVATLANGASTVDACLLAVDQLNELLRGRGHELWALHSRMYELIRAGELDKARSIVSQPPLDDATVAWVAFGNADLGRAIVRVGQVRFFDGRIGLKTLKAQCTHNANDDFAPFDELTDQLIDADFNDVEADHVVFARVELAGDRAKSPPDGRRVPPVSWARELASNLVEAAGFRHGGTEWVLLYGGRYFTARGTDGGSVGFADPRLQAEREHASNPRYRPTGGRLYKLPTEFADALAEAKPGAQDAAEAVRWHRQTSKLSNPSMRVALHVRRFEVQWSTGDHGGWQTWKEPLCHYLKDSWCRRKQNDALFRGGLVLDRDQHLAHPLSGISDAAAEVYQSTAGGDFTINLKATMRLAPELAGGFAGGTLQRRLLKELARSTRDGKAAQDWWRDLREAFDILLKRAVRQRNRVIHGREPVPTVIDSVDAFISWLSATLAAQAVSSAGGGRGINDVLEEDREFLADQFDALAAQPSAQTLFE
jgi:hypothetical protein